MGLNKREEKPKENSPAKLLYFYNHPLTFPIRYKERYESPAVAQTSPGKKEPPPTINSPCTKPGK